MRQKGTFKVITTVVAVLFFLSLASGQTQDEQQAKKRRGEINLSMGYAKSDDNEKGNFGLLKSVGWNLLSGWMSAGINFGIIKNEIMVMGNISFNIPLDRIELFATAGYGGIIESFALVSNYGGGIRIRVGKKIGIISEYRKLHFKYKNRQRETESTIMVDYIGAGIFYHF